MGDNDFGNLNDYPEPSSEGISISNEQAFAFILSDEIENFLPLLKPRQREAIEIFRESRGTRLMDNFKFALENIKSYLQFLTRNQELPSEDAGVWKVFTRITAPYFWREERRAAMSQVKYSTLSPDNPIIKEYIIYRINSLIPFESDAELKERTIYTLKYGKGLTEKEVANLFNINSSLVQLYAKKFAILVGNANINIEQLVIEFLNLTPIERQVFLLSQSSTIEEVASALDTSVGAIWSTRNRIYQKLGIHLPDTTSTSQIFLNLDTIPGRKRAFIPKSGLQLQRKPVEELLAEYLLRPGSRYKKELQSLMISGKRDLVELYFLLQEIPDRELVGDILGYSSITIKHKLTDLKKSLMDQSDPLYSQRDYDSWIEITRLGKMFLLSDEDLNVISTIRSLRSDVPNLSINYLADTMGISSSSLKYRIKRIKELFGITEERLSLLPELIKGREQ